MADATNTPDLSTLDRAALIAFADANEIRVTKLPNVRDVTILHQIETAMAAKPDTQWLVPGDDNAIQSPAEGGGAPQENAGGDPPVVEPATEPATPPVVDETKPADPPVTEPVAEAAAPAPTEPYDPDPVIRFAHPDNGSCDAYPTDEDGNVLAPASAAAELGAHGFLPVSDNKKD